MMETIRSVLKNIWSLNADQIAIISVLITFLLFVLGKLSENQIKKYETRKEEYKNLIGFFQDMFSSSLCRENLTEIVQSKDFKKKFLNMGASTAIFGSKKLYKTYCFYRMLSLDENVQNSRWYSNDMIVYALGEMYTIMRKEIGLNHDVIPIDVPDILAFYINDFTKSDFKKKYYKYHYNKYAIQSAVFWGKIEDLLPLVWLQNYIIKPFFLLIFFVIRFPFKLLIITPIKQIKKLRNTDK